MKEVDHWSVGLTEAECQGVKKYQAYQNIKQKLNRTIWKARNRRRNRRSRLRYQTLEEQCIGLCPYGKTCLTCFTTPEPSPEHPEPPEKKEQEEKKEDTLKESNS